MCDGAADTVLNDGEETEEEEKSSFHALILKNLIHEECEYINSI